GLFTDFLPLTSTSSGDLNRSLQSATTGTLILGTRESSGSQTHLRRDCASPNLVDSLLESITLREGKTDEVIFAVDHPAYPWLVDRDGPGARAWEHASRRRSCG